MAGALDDDRRGHVIRRFEERQRERRERRRSHLFCGLLLLQRVRVLSKEDVAAFAADGLDLFLELRRQDAATGRAHQLAHRNLDHNISVNANAAASLAR